MRSLWKQYFSNTQGLIFVVDSIDRDRIDEAKGLLIEEELRDASLLVFANKQDLEAMSVAEITEKLGLHMLENRAWYIQGTVL